MRACRTDWHQTWGLAELIIFFFFFFFWQTCCFQNWFLVQMRLKWNFLNWVLAKFSGLGAENLPNYVFWTENWEILWFLIKKGHGSLEELKNAEKVFFFFFFFFLSCWGSLKWGSFPLHIPITLFTVYKYPQNNMIKWCLHVYDPWNILSW